MAIDQRQQALIALANDVWNIEFLK